MAIAKILLSVTRFNGVRVSSPPNLPSPILRDFATVPFPVLSCVSSFVYGREARLFFELSSKCFIVTAHISV